VLMGGSTIRFVTSICPMRPGSNSFGNWITPIVVTYLFGWLSRAAC
jgi:hypothetical protein